VGVGKLSLTAVKRVLEEVGVKPELDANEADGLLAAVNPAVGVPDELLGFFAFHYLASNVAAAFGKPEFALLDLVLPPGYLEERALFIIRTFAGKCRKYGVKLVSGHTGRYEGTEYPIASSARAVPGQGDRLLRPLAGHARFGSRQVPSPSGRHGGGTPNQAGLPGLRLHGDRARVP